MIPGIGRVGVDLRARLEIKTGPAGQIDDALLRNVAHFRGFHGVGTLLRPMLNDTKNPTRFQHTGKFGEYRLGQFVTDPAMGITKSKKQIYRVSFTE